jgi:2-keto-3-deoxy-L-rhamnonate aldolase RhmA
MKTEPVPSGGLSAETLAMKLFALRHFREQTAERITSRTTRITQYFDRGLFNLAIPMVDEHHESSPRSEYLALRRRWWPG